jgi:hypothetical protein
MLMRCEEAEKWRPEIRREQQLLERTRNDEGDQEQQTGQTGASEPRARQEHAA